MERDDAYLIDMVLAARDAAELEAERQWAELFARPESEDMLECLADEALSEHRAGRTRPPTVNDI